MNTDDGLFRWFILAGMLLMIPIGAYYRIRSQMTGEKLDRTQEGLFILIGVRLIAFLFLLGLVVYLLDPERMSWSSVPLPAWLRWVGVGLWAATVGLYAWTFHHLGKNITDTVVTRREHTLVTSGPYRWVRHPFYIVVGLFFLANALAAANWFLLLTGGLVLALLVARTRKEEEKLIERFGDDYRKYMRQTGRFLPRLGGPGSQPS
jgi:protein-S-isoprenylcysteine O-methyltransferase Ste14